MKFKSVIGAFLFIFLATFVALVIFVQSERFARIVTKIVSEISAKEYQTKVEVRKFSISLFPPGIELNQVKIRKEWSPEEIFEGELGTVGFYIGLIEFEEKKLTLGEIKIVDAVIDYKKPKSPEELKEIDSAIIDKVFKSHLFSPFRIDKLTFENSKITINQDSLEVQKIKLFRTNKTIIARFHISNIAPESLKGLTIDEVWGDSEISPTRIKLYRLKFQHDVHTALVKGSIKNYAKLAGAEFDLNGETQIFLKGLKKFIPDSRFAIESGNLRSSFRFNYLSENFTGNADIYVESMRSDLIDSNEIRAALSLNGDLIKLDSFDLTLDEQKLILEESVVLYDKKLNRYLSTPLTLMAQRFSLKNLLQFGGSKTKSLEGFLSGGIYIQRGGTGYKVKLTDKFAIDNFTLKAGSEEKPFEILKIKKAVFNNTEINEADEEIKLKTEVSLPNSRMEITGAILPKSISFSTPLSKIDLRDFGNISQLDILGVGDLSVKVDGPHSDVQIQLAGKTKGFSILGYRLDETDKDIVIDLGSSTVFINKLESRLGKTSLSGSGSVNYANADIALGISTGETNANDLREILAPILKNVKNLPDDLDMKAQVDIDIFGKYRFPELKLRSRLTFSDLHGFGETINSGSFGLSLKEEVLKFEGIELNKGSGSISGEVALNLKDDNFLIKTAWENLELSQFDSVKKTGINLLSTFSGKLEGGGPFNDYKLKLNSLFFNTRNASNAFGDSRLSFTATPKSISGNVNLLGDFIVSKYSVALNNSASSEIDFLLNTMDIKPILIAFGGSHIELENISGGMRLEAKASFEQDLKNLDLTVALKKLSFHHPEFNFDYLSTAPEFIVKDSVIERWVFQVDQPDIKLKTKGQGTFGDNVSLRLDSKVSAKILEILSSRILSSDGIMENTFLLEGKDKRYNYSLTSRASEIDLSIEGLPVQVDNLRYNLSLGSNRLNIDQFVFSLENGSFDLRGDVFFDGDQPDVNLKFILDKAEIPILGKSAINLSGEGIVLGNNYPYTVGGEIVINRAQIINELNEFNTKSAGFSQVRFLPKTQESPLGKMFLINMNIKAESPVRLTNSLMDVALVGEVRLLGNPGRLKGEGRLTTPVNSSRIFFKNNEYLIQSADINFNPQKEISNPDFDIQALTIISSYKIYPKAYGDLERFNFDLTSEPVLPRNSILSLIAFGYTDEIQSSLYAKDQQSLTQVGVGSFVFDRFKISDILNKQFGLQVNLGTVIEQSATDSLLSGRNQAAAGTTGAGVLGRTRSATKIELKKRLDEALTLSVSSTMGGTIGQRQSMNLNYGVSKNIQLEGVYELRTNEEGQADIIYNSIGGDLKFRRTFK